jgi:Na+/H+ antiporter NhaD/arsenite permease-like protein
MVPASIAFVLVLALVATERIHRTKIALIGAAGFVLAGVLTQEQAIAALDIGTLGLLAGMMVIVALIEQTGALTYAAVRTVQVCGGSGPRVLFALSGLTAVLSAFLDNLTAILVVAPITLAIARTLDMRPTPLLIVQVLACNIGGTATLIGDPPNIMIGNATGLSFNAFLANVAPIAVATLVLVISLIYLTRRTDFATGDEAHRVDELVPGAHLASGRDLWIPIGVGAVTVAGFFVHHSLGLQPPTIALSGAAAMLLLSRANVDATLKQVDWATLLFFAALFVMVGGLEEVGAIDEVARWVEDATAGDRTAELVGIVWVSAIGSGLVDNIPFTAAMIPVVDSVATEGDDAHWWALSLGTCFGGNFTMIAAAANVACAGMAERAGHPIGFLRFLAWGVPVTLVSLSVATVYVLIRYG